MKLAVMQPYFFPYLGYFQLMAAVDRWIAFENTQFINKGWVNRNRILHPSQEKEWQYITLPISHRRQKARISDLSISDSVAWKEDITGKLSHYKSKAPHYYRALSLVEECFAFSDSNLSGFLANSLTLTAQFLGIKTAVDSIPSTIDLPETVEHPGQWAILIAKQLNANEYINPHGGYEIFIEDEFYSANIKLCFLRPKLKKYDQKRAEFIQSLSILDVIMWNSESDIKLMIENDFEIVSYKQLESSTKNPS